MRRGWRRQQCLLQLLSVAGMLATLWFVYMLLCDQTRRVYVDENAVLPSGAPPPFLSDSVEVAEEIDRQIRAEVSIRGGESTIASICTVLASHGLSVSYHEPKSAEASNTSNKGAGVCVATLLTDNIDGEEAFALVTGVRADEWRFSHPTLDRKLRNPEPPMEMSHLTEARFPRITSAALGGAILTQLSQVRWLSKNVVFVIALHDEELSAYQRFDKWLGGYEDSSEFAGALVAGVAFELPPVVPQNSVEHYLETRRHSDGDEEEIDIADLTHSYWQERPPIGAFDTLSMDLVAEGAQLPNLDLVSALDTLSRGNIIVSHREDAVLCHADNVSLEHALKAAYNVDIPHLVYSFYATSFGRWFDEATGISAYRMVQHAVRLTRELERFCTPFRFVSDTLTNRFAQSDSFHSALRKRGVDALTLRGIRLSERQSQQNTRSSVNDLGRVLLGMTRAVSNLIERLHHSHFFYVMVSPYGFLEQSKYLPVVAFCIAPVGLFGILNYLRLAKKTPQTFESALRFTVLTFAPSLVAWLFRGYVRILVLCVVAPLAVVSCIRIARRGDFCFHLTRPLFVVPLFLLCIGAAFALPFLSVAVLLWMQLVILAGTPSASTVSALAKTLLMTLLNPLNAVLLYHYTLGIHVWPSLLETRLLLQWPPHLLLLAGVMPCFCACLASVFSLPVANGNAEGEQPPPHSQSPQTDTEHQKIE